MAAVEVLKHKLEKLENQRELYWKQQAKVHWLKHGDRNTKFFHGFASERRRRNRIQKLIDDDGRVVEEARGMLSLVTNYYTSLFQSNAGAGYDELLQRVPRRVDGHMNDELMKEYSEEEIKAALENMGDLKAPGSDGMPIYSINNIGTLLEQML